MNEQLDPNFCVSFAEVCRKWRTETPNIIFEMLHQRQLSHSAFILYSFYRKIAGENGRCWMGTRKLAELSGLSPTTIASSKKELTSRLDILNGKSLITITPCNRKLEIADIITINDIWPENHTYFQNNYTCTKSRHTGVPNRDTRVYQNVTQKKEPIKKRPYKKDIIATDPADGKTMPAGGNNNSSHRSSSFKNKAPEPKAPPPKEEPPPPRGDKHIYPCLMSCDDLSDPQKIKISRHPELLVESTVRYCYHPTTQVRGGPVGRLKLIQHILANYEDYRTTIETLDKPTEEPKKSKKELLVGRFKRGEVYNGFEFLQDDHGVGFLHPSGHIYSVSWKSLNFAKEFTELLQKLKLE